MSKFAKAKPNLGPSKKSSTTIDDNRTSLKHPAVIKKAGKNNRSSWVLCKVIHKGKAFDPEAIKAQKGKPAFQPKPKQISYITYQNKDTDTHPDEFFCHAVRLKDRSYKPLTWVQEKKLLAASNYRNNVQLVQPKGGIDLERIKAYGNRLPRVGVLTDEQPLHYVGFLSDRNALKELELESLAELVPQAELLYGERGPYIPKYLNALVVGVEEENDELSVEEDEEEEDNDEEQVDEEEDVEEEPDEEDESEDEASAQSEDVMDVDQSSDQQEAVPVEDESLAVSSALHGGKYEQIHNVISKTDMLARMQQLDTADSEHTLTHSGKHPSMQASNKRKAPAAEKEKSAKKQKPSVPKPAAKAKPAPKTKPSPKKKAPAKPSPQKKASPAKKAPLAPKKAPVAAPSADEGYHSDYPTADRIAEGYEKIIANEKIQQAWTKPQLAECFSTETRLIDLMEDKADETTLQVAVPFLYELFAKHYQLPVPTHSKVNVGNAPSKALCNLSQKLAESVSWTDAVNIAETILAEAKKERENETQQLPLIQLIDEAVQRRDTDSLTVLHSVVFTENALVRVGMAGDGKQSLEDYLATLKNVELQKTLFNMYLAFLEYTKDEDAEEAEEDKAPEEEEEFSIF